jgi:4-amino-4-deoxy-L-arabinose transferase-like glycosyltransferase
MAGVALAALWLHLFAIASLPRGFYVDEASIGYNAHLIAQSGVDEHGERWPLFFKAFGEYKNPLYIYLLALIYKLLGYSLWSTRAASAVCWLLGTLFILLLGRRMFSDVRTQLYLLLCASFTPWLFSLSRISFEVVSLYPLLALHLWAVYRAYEEGSKSWAFVAGLAIALTLYAYSSFRLLAPLHVAAVLLCYAGKPYWRLHVPLIAGSALAASPYAVYFARNYSALAFRFNYLTYLHDASFSVPAKVGMFWERYFGYLGPQFLALSGDPNRRHHSGYGGELLAVTGLLLVLGIAATLAAGALWKRPFIRLLFAGLLISPVAASLTFEVHHSLRAFSLAVFAILLSAAGMNVLSERRNKLLASLVLAAVAVNACLYIRDYFTRYPSESVAAFETFGLKEALEAAAGTARGKVVLNEGIHRSQTNLRFFAPLVANPRGVVLEVGGESDVRPGDVFVDLDPSGRAAGVRAGLPEGSRFVGLRYRRLRRLRRDRP